MLQTGELRGAAAPREEALAVAVDHRRGLPSPGVQDGRHADAARDHVLRRADPRAVPGDALDDVAGQSGALRHRLEDARHLARVELAALVPRPKAHLVRYHALFAPNARHRHLIVPRRTRRPSRPPGDDARTNTPMSWMARLKRVFNLDISVCPKCGGKVRVIATVTEPNAIAQILDHLHRRDHEAGEPRGPPPRLLG